MTLTRRTALGAAALPWLAGCATPLPLGAGPSARDDGAASLLAESAQAHGLAAFRALKDVSIGYDGRWRPLIGRVQPEVVDAGYRVRAEERMLPAAGVHAQVHTGPLGTKQVVRTRPWPASAGSSARDLGRVGVWRNGVPDTTASSTQAAALVADGYLLFLLGPLWLAGAPLPMARAGRERVDGVACDLVQVWLAPGLGLVEADRVALCIDPATGLMRRVRFTLEGFPGTRGAVAEVDTFEHVRRFGVAWPMRSYERVVHPIALPAHDWHVTGLEVDRGFGVADLDGPALRGAAAAPATL